MLKFSTYLVLIRGGGPGVLNVMLDFDGQFFGLENPTFLVKRDKKSPKSIYLFYLESKK